MLQYALLHLFGFGLTMQDLKDFRVSTELDGHGNRKMSQADSCGL